MTDAFAFKKETAAAWFKTLRDNICQRKVDNGGGGTGGMLRGRLFEKCGVHISVVKGEFDTEMAARVPGADKDPSFWAAGISLIAHPWTAPKRVPMPKPFTPG